MLGAARASEYAGWWVGDVSRTVTMTSSSTFNYTLYQDPNFAWENDSIDTGVGGVSTGSINLSNVGSQSGYSQYSHAIFGQIRCNSAANTSNQKQAQFTMQLVPTGGASIVYLNIYVTPLTNGNVGIGGNFGFANDTNIPYANIANKWITIGQMASDTSSSFSNWSGGSGNVYSRTVMVDTQTGNVLYKDDVSGDGNDVKINYTGNINNPAYTIATTGNVKPYVDPALADPPLIGGYWFCGGATFDPLTADSAWRTPTPPKQIGNAVCWYNAQYVEYANVSGTYYLKTGNDQDLYSQASGYQGLFTNNANTWSSNYNTTYPIESSN